MEERRSRGNCSIPTLHAFSLEENSQMIRVDVLIVINAILAAIMVGIVVYGPRYRHCDSIRFLFQWATTLFLPILSYVVSNGSSIASSVGTLGQLHTYLFQTENRLETLQSSCYAWGHLGGILLWANLVQIVEINTCAIVAADDREGRSIGPPMVLAVQVIWTSYLAVYNAIQIGYWFVYTFLLVFPLLFTKMILKYFAFRKAKHSFALGRNPRLIVGYMEQLREESKHATAMVEHLPPLIVMGEDRQPVEKHPRGYRMKWMPNQNCITMVKNNNLVTIDKIWQLDDMVMGSVPWSKDICFSFALFKMLRCLFAGYTAGEAGLMEAHNFFWHVLLKDIDAERLFGVFEDELSFLHDFYYLSFPISYSKSWLPIAKVLTSLLTIIYCLLLGLGLYLKVINTTSSKDGQITCYVWCNNFVESIENYCNRMGCIDSMDRIEIGNLYFDLVPVFVLLALVVLSEIKDSASYICCNWTKVAVTCLYVMSHENRQQSSPKMQRWVSRLLQCRFKFMKHWDDKMNQSSLFLLHQKKTPVVLLKRLFRLPDQQKKNVKVPRAVKVAIVEALKRRNGIIQANYSNILRRGMPDGDKFLWACSGEGTVDIILTWHIATAIVEIRYSQQPQSPVSSDNKIVATHLSQYCAYLVAYVPGLLPDDDPWCKKLYKAVKEDFTRVLSGGTVTPTEYEQLVSLLTERSEHEVLKKGVRLGKQLAAESEQEKEMVWRLLADFWSALILSVAPSGRLDEHAEAIARGGELVTLLWALLLHAGTGPSDGPAWSIQVRV
ncbi:unnamed protein product [Urochloa humidicola]